MDIDLSTLIWIVRLVFLTIAILATISVWNLMRRERFISVPSTPSYRPPQHIDLPEKNVVFAVMAKPGRVFDNSKLFKTMHELGFQFSENHIFEYFIPDSKNIAFSVINMRTPNAFPDPESMRPTNGLVAIMQLPIGDGDNQVKYFHLLLSVLDEIQENLEAELCDLNRNLMKNKKLYEIQKDIENFEQSYAALIQNDYQRNHS